MVVVVVVDNHTGIRKKMVQKKQYRILVCPVDAVGHVNACLGLAKPLKQRGHQVAFFTGDTHQEKIKSNGFDGFYYKAPAFSQAAKDGNTGKKAGEDLAFALQESGILGQCDIKKQFDAMAKMFENSPAVIEFQKVSIKVLLRAIEEFQPDIFLVDNNVLPPPIYYSGKPWILIMSPVPLWQIYDDEDLPPCFTGLSINSDKKEWSKYTEFHEKFRYNKEINDYFEEIGYKRYPNDICKPCTESMTVYAFPEEYNYPQIKNRKNYFNVEVFNKNETRETVDLKELVPKEFFEDDLDGKWSGKWIYVSMGSMGSVDLDLMNRLCGILAKTNHKYIVSKGPRHSEYELPRNMWGDRFLPQIKIIPSMDLVLTHGGNNTVTETFAQGVPMIVFPLFADQHDNATRLDEMNVGIKIPPYDFEDQQLIDAVEKLLNDNELRCRLVKAAERIRTSNNHEIFCDKLEEIIENHPSQNGKTQ